jgi:hypothetical protein
MDYDTMKQFLINSKLGHDLNNAFNPYSLKVIDVSREKLFFTTRKDLLKSGNIESNPDSIPENILDCITWVKLGKLIF